MEAPLEVATGSAVRHRTMAEAALERLREAIIMGELTAGTQVTLEVLASDFRPQTGRSLKLSVGIITPADLRARLFERQTEILRKLYDILVIQRTARKELGLVEARFGQLRRLEKGDLDGLERVPGKTFFWAGVYSADMNDRTTLRTDLNVFADFEPKLPAGYRSQPYLLLGNIQPELQRNVRAQMNGLRLVGGDTMNYWIADHRADLLKTIAEWDFLLINDSEARMLSGANNLRRVTLMRSLGRPRAARFYCQRHRLPNPNPFPWRKRGNRALR